MGMDLNREMKELLFCLLREGDWITGDELAGKLGWNRKKIQQNIRYLSEESGGDCSIEAQKNKGYLLIGLSEEYKAELLQDVFYNGAYFNLDERRTMLVLVLLFQDGYISMDRLAEEYYMSKTSVFEEMRHIRRWFDRTELLELEVSSKNGVRICGTERAKRYCCAAYAQPAILKLLRLDEIAVMRYQGILKSSAKVLKKAVLSGGIFLSGEAYALILRYIGMTWLRSHLGYQLEEDSGETGKELEDELFRELAEATGYSFTVAEQGLIMELIRYSNVVAVGCSLPEGSAGKAEQMKAFILKELQLPSGELYDDRALWVQNVDSMLYSLAQNRHTVNYYDKEILRKYPLSIHLTRQAFREIYGRKLSRSDVLDMAAYLGAFLDNVRYPAKIRILLAGNQNYQLLANIRRYVTNMLPFVPECFDLLPCYVIEEDMQDYCKKYDLLLTTEPEMLLKEPGFLFVPVVMTDEHIEVVRLKIREWMKRYAENKLRELEEGIEYLELEKLESLCGLFPEDDLGHMTVYVLNRNTLFLEGIFCGRPTGVRRITLKNKFFYDYRPITEIIAVQYREGEPGIVEYFKMVAQLLQKLG